MSESDQIVQALLDDLADKRAKQEADDYAFFGKATSEVRESYYKYWINAHSDHDVPMPRFLIDFEKDHKKT